MRTLGLWIAVALGVFLGLSILFGLFPQAFFLFYTGAAALGLLGIAFLVLPGSIVGEGAFRRGLIMLLLSPLMFIYGLVVQAIYSGLQGGKAPQILPGGLFDTFVSQHFLNVPFGGWLLLVLVAVNVIGIGRGLRARQVLALNIWVVASGIFIAYILISK